MFRLQVYYWCDLCSLDSSPAHTTMIIDFPMLSFVFGAITKWLISNSFTEELCCAVKLLFKKKYWINFLFSLIFRSRQLLGVITEKGKELSILNLINFKWPYQRSLAKLIQNHFAWLMRANNSLHIDLSNHRHHQAREKKRNSHQTVSLKKRSYQQMSDGNCVRRLFLLNCHSHYGTMLRPESQKNDHQITQSA